MVVLPLDFEVLNESIPVDFQKSIEPMPVDFYEVQVVSTCRISVRQVETVLIIE